CYAMLRKIVQIHPLRTPGTKNADRKQAGLWQSVYLVRGHSSRVYASRVELIIGTQARNSVVVAAVAVWRSWTIVHLHCVAAKCKSLSPTKFCPLLESSHLTLAGKFMLFRIHPHVVLREASVAMLGKERAVSTLQDIHLRIRELGVLVM